MKAPGSANQEFMHCWGDVIAPSSMGYRIRLLGQLLSRKFQERMESYGLTPFHWVVLCCLWQEDGLPTSAICERLKQVGGTLTGVLDRMEERGLVRRERDQQDRRVWRIWLSEEGERLRTILPPVAREIKDLCLQGIPEQDRKRLSEVIDRAIANLS